jgi:hypothetical protein
MRPLSPELLLRAWEHGRRRHPIDRAVMLHALAEPALDPDRLPDAPLGDRNAAILRLRQATFGARLRAVLDCPECGERLELDADTTTLLAASAREAAPVEVDSLCFRPPTSRDLVGILGESDAEAARLRLLRLCLVGDGESADPQLLASLGDRVEDALEQADPLADLTLGFVCDACGHEWQAPLDVAAFLWDEVDVHARRLLDEVHLIARAYGWSEAEILALPEARRAAYIERVGS